MKGSDTELNDLKIPNYNKSNRRSSWYSLASDSSNAQTTMYSAKKITTGNESIRSNHNLEQSERDTEIPVSNLSHRKSNTPLSSNQSEIEDENDVRPTSDQQATKTSNTEANSPPTSNFVTKFIKAFPPFSQTRRTIKASIALLIATIFILDSNTRAATGESVLLVAIVVIFYFPVRTIGM